jgi:hypothetical protein
MQRYKQYPKGSALVFVTRVVDAVTVEAEVIRAFRLKFKQRRDQGLEYFTGNYLEMQRCILQVVAQTAPESDNSDSIQQTRDTEIYDLLFEFLSSSQDSWNCKDGADVYLHFECCMQWIKEQGKHVRYNLTTLDFEAFATYFVEYVRANNKELDKKVAADLAPPNPRPNNTHNFVRIARIRSHIQRQSQRQKHTYISTPHDEDNFTAFSHTMLIKADGHPPMDMDIVYDEFKSWWRREINPSTHRLPRRRQLWFFLYKQLHGNTKRSGMPSTHIPGYVMRQEAATNQEAAS